jgi:hypothetical protein
MHSNTPRVADTSPPTLRTATTLISQLVRSTPSPPPPPKSYDLCTPSWPNRSQVYPLTTQNGQLTLESLSICPAALHSSIQYSSSASRPEYTTCSFITTQGSSTGVCVTIPTGLAKAYFLTTRSKQATQVGIAIPDDVMYSVGAPLEARDARIPVEPSVVSQPRTYHIVLSIRSSLAKESASIGLQGLIFHT